VVISAPIAKKKVPLYEKRQLMLWTLITRSKDERSRSRKISAKVKGKAKIWGLIYRERMSVRLGKVRYHQLYLAAKKEISKEGGGGGISKGNSGSSSVSILMVTREPKKRIAVLTSYTFI